MLRLIRASYSNEFLITKVLLVQNVLDAKCKLTFETLLYTTLQEYQQEYQEESISRPFCIQFILISKKRFEI